jgi:hypothetical protein
VNRSAGDVADVPSAVVTVTATAPVPTGATAVSEVGERNATLEAALEPKCTVEVGVKPVPVMVTLVPPPAGPVDGLRPVTVGGPM